MSKNRDESEGETPPIRTDAKNWHRLREHCHIVATKLPPSASGLRANRSARGAVSGRCVPLGEGLRAQSMSDLVPRASRRAFRFQGSSRSQLSASASMRAIQRCSILICRPPVAALARRPARQAQSGGTMRQVFVSERENIRRTHGRAVPSYVISFNELPETVSGEGRPIVACRGPLDGA